MSWQQTLVQFRTNTSASPWKLPRALVADQIAAIVADPRCVNQGGFGFCGIASFVHLWAKVRPDEFVEFATEIYDSGWSSIGEIQVKPRHELVAHDYSVAVAADWRCNEAQWMIMGSIQDHFSPLGFDGTRNDSWVKYLVGREGQNPKQIVSLLENCGGYLGVVDDTDFESLFPPEPARTLARENLRDALLLKPCDTTHVLLQIHSNLLKDRWPFGFCEPPTDLAELAEWATEQFPNHFVVLTAPIRVERALTSRPLVHLQLWSWGGAYDVVVEKKAFEQYYFGAITCTVRPRMFPRPSTPELNGIVVSHPVPAVPTMTDVELNWTEAGGLVTEFEVQRRAPALGDRWMTAARIAEHQTPSDGGIFVDHLPAPVSRLEYRVRAINLDWASDWSASREAIAQQHLPAAPFALSATITHPLAPQVVAITDVKIVWRVNAADNDIDFDIEFRTPALGGKWQKVASIAAPKVGAEEGAYTNRLPLLWPSLEYRVRARNIAGYGDWSVPLAVR